MKEVAIRTTMPSYTTLSHFINLPTHKLKSLSPSEETNHVYSKGYPVKRLLDVLVASVILVLLSPISLLILLAIIVESRGPAIYTAKRMGSDYRVFDFYKFRTMRTGADEHRRQLALYNHYDSVAPGYHPPDTPFFFKLKNDPRVTEVGKFLRKTSLDELPQLINVLKGDMSLVGNRPLPLDEAATLVSEPYKSRFLAPAGITGLWQVAKNKDNMSVAQRIELDLQYVQRCSLSTDLRILLKTLPAMLQQ